MTITHRIGIVREKSSRSTVSSTRKSKTRRYVACIVTTTTQRTLDLMAAERTEAAAAVAEASAQLAALEKLFGMTTEQALTKQKRNEDLWFGDHKPGSRGILDVEREIAIELDGLDYWKRPQRGDLKQRARERLVAEGRVDPFDKNGIYAFVTTHQRKSDAQWLLDHQPKLQLGDQAVVSWHQSMALAEKALGSREANFHREQGDAVEIRTDIEVR
jgi:hypothetical protein